MQKVLGSTVGESDRVASGSSCGTGYKKRHINVVNHGRIEGQVVLGCRPKIVYVWEGRVGGVHSATRNTPRTHQAHNGETCSNGR